MKSLPVIQDPRGQAVPDQPGSSGGRQPETTGMVNDTAKAAEFLPRVVQMLKTVFDPEIPVDIYELGLIYEIIVETSGVVGIRMTLTAPACPAAQFLPAEVKKKVAGIPGVTDVKLDVVWEPPWDRDRMSDAAKLQLGMF